MAHLNRKSPLPHPLSPPLDHRGGYGRPTRSAIVCVQSLRLSDSIRYQRPSKLPGQPHRSPEAVRHRRTPHPRSHECLYAHPHCTRRQDTVKEPLSRPGDYIEFEAEGDLIVGLSCCPQDQNPCNAYHITDLRVEVFSHSL